jgi:short-subunit dehydrogenase
MQTEFQQGLGVTPNGPSFMWQDPAGVARAGLDAVAQNRAVEVPGMLHRIAATASGMLPTGFTRRASEFVLRQAAKH